jgi:hypothetical protein
MYTRDEVITMMKEKVISITDITAAWEGGSTSTGYDDEYSDLDMYLVTKEGNEEQVLIEIVKFIEFTFGIEKKFRMPEPSPHGFKQVFVKTINTPELFYIDFVVMNEEVEDKFVSIDRHGNPNIWVDSFKVDTSPRSIEQMNAMCNAIYDSTVARDFILILELKKQIKRELFSEIFPLYLSFISRCIVSLLNIKYRPEKADFGMRYIYRDYPEKEHKLIEDALKAATIEEVRYNFDILLNLYESLVIELKSSI